MLKVKRSTSELCVGERMFPIVSPWSGSGNAITLTRKMEGDYIFLRGGRIDNAYFVDFISLRIAGEIRRWAVDSDGAYLHQYHSTPLAGGDIEVDVVQDAPFLIGQLKGPYNDLNIHSVLYFIYGPGPAQDYMDAYAPPTSGPPRRDPQRQTFFSLRKSSKPASARNVYVCVIFNHNYARNIPILHESLSSRFSQISYLLPTAAPRHPSCYSYPVGSYQYHLFISLHITAMLAANTLAPEDIILFVHDDVLIRNDINEANIDQVMGMSEPEALFSYHCEVGQDHSDSWPWNQRINIAVNDNRAMVGGNGFEGSRLIMTDSILRRGLGDVFVVKARALETFNYLLSQYCAGNVFPEVAIPTSIYASAKLLGGVVSPFKLLDLWSNRSLVRDKAFIRQFHEGEAHFLHPFKYNWDRA